MNLEAASLENSLAAGRFAVSYGHESLIFVVILPILGSIFLPRGMFVLALRQLFLASKQVSSCLEATFSCLEASWFLPRSKFFLPRGMSVLASKQPFPASKHVYPACFHPRDGLKRNFPPSEGWLRSSRGGSRYLNRLKPPRRLRRHPSKGGELPPRPDGHPSGGGEFYSFS